MNKFCLVASWGEPDDARCIGNHTGGFRRSHTQNRASTPLKPPKNAQKLQALVLETDARVLETDARVLGPTRNHARVPPSTRA